MLSMIKGIINQKKDFLEAANIILEDTLDDLDDAIVLGEDTDMDMTDDQLPEITESDDEPKDENEKDDNDDHDENENEDDDIMNQSIEDDNHEEDNENDDILSSPVMDDPEQPTNTEEPHDEPMTLGDDDLPEPVSNVTGEPVVDDGITSMEIDLGSNTMKDVLPVPPANAGEAIADDDIMNQHIDSGFGGEPEVPTEDMNPADNGDDIMNEEIDDVPVTEAITIGDEGSTSDAENTEPAPLEDEPVADTDVAPDAGAEDNTVTDAVKDKIAEAETDAPSTDEDSSAKKEALMKKLSNMTKNLEDLKTDLMKSGTV